MTTCFIAEIMHACLTTAKLSSGQLQHTDQDYPLHSPLSKCGAVDRFGLDHLHPGAPCFLLPLIFRKKNPVPVLFNKFRNLKLIFLTVYKFTQSLDLTSMSLQNSVKPKSYIEADTFGDGSFMMSQYTSMCSCKDNKNRRDDIFGFHPF